MTRSTDCSQCGGPLTGRQQKFCSERCRNQFNGRKNYPRNGAPDAQRERLLRHRYGIGVEQYNKILTVQGGGCALCKKPNNPAHNHGVDHDHKTGAVRGILCIRCNAYILGALTLEQVRAAVEYLSNPPALAAIGVVTVPPRPPRKRKRKRRKAG